VSWGAQFSPCGRYRYALWRDVSDRALKLGEVPGVGTVLFVMLNPSTADAVDDDPTIRRCIGFARRWGYEKLTVANLFALRATNPRELLTAQEPIGPDNDLWLMRLYEKANLTITAWGAHNMASDRAEQVARKVFRRMPYKRLATLGTTKEGHPRHPLYLRHDIEPQDWKP
jgi:hypothetical protein